MCKERKKRQQKNLPQPFVVQKRSQFNSKLTTQNGWFTSL